MQIFGKASSIPMFIVKKLKRNLYILIVATLFGYVIFALVFNDRYKYFDSRLNISRIEEAIKSNSNYAVCKIPDLLIDAPEIMKFYHLTKPLNCGNTEDWITCEMSTCEIKQTVIKEKGKVQCWYNDLIRITDHRTDYGKTTKTSSKYELRASDFAKVYCRADNGDVWFGIAIGLRDSVKLPTFRDDRVFLNVLMLGFDSMSRNAFIRKLPKTYKYLTEELGGHILKGYNIVGDATSKAIVPMMTGYTELELPDTRKRVKGTAYVDVYPSIWKDFKALGYITALNEDLPDSGIFTFKFRGFNKQPTDHYMRPYYLEVDKYWYSWKKCCIGNNPGHQIMLKYEGYPRFVFSFHGELTHGYINRIGVADDDLVNWMKDLRNAGILEKTVLILMSDHGNRYAEIRNTLQGKQEERLPFFSFVFPQIFKKQFAKEYKTFLQNTDILTTPFDIHETLSDIIRMQTSNFSSPEYSKSRAISLFKPIPKTRSCADAYIEPHWCTCLHWTPVNHTIFPLARSIAMALVNKMNAFTRFQRNLCEYLKLNQIHWIQKLVPQENLLRFKQSLDEDKFIPDFTSKTEITSEIYQVKITTLPGNSIFEASVTHKLKKNEFIVNLSDVSRVNKYGTQAACIQETYPELRKYCFCKTIIQF